MGCPSRLAAVLAAAFVLSVSAPGAQRSLAPPSKPYEGISLFGRPLAAAPATPAAMQQLVKMGVRAEQQALARWGLNYVIDEYLPAKLKHPEKFLP